jgi:hypothetical protein
MPEQMSRDDALSALDGVRAAMHDRHPGNRARLEQLDCHLATVAMVVDHLYDEAARGEGN